MLEFSPLSIVIQIVSFCVLWFGLKHWLFDPFMHVLELRDARTTGARRAAAEIKAAAERSAAEHERRLQDVRRALSAEGEAARAKVQNDELQTLTEARARANADLLQLRNSLTQQAAAARPAIATEAQDLSRRMVERVVGRTGN